MQLPFPEFSYRTPLLLFIEHPEEVPGVHRQTDHGADKGGMADSGGANAAPPQGSARVHDCGMFC